MTVLELIGKIGVEGESQFQGAMGRASAAAQKLGDTVHRAGAKANDALNKLSSTSERASSSISGFLTQSLEGAAAAAAAFVSFMGVEKLLSFGFAALKAAGDWEALGITLDAITGSAQRAQDKLKFIRELAIPAVTTKEALARAGVTLESFGVRLERALPLAAKLQAAFQFKPEALMEAVEIMGRLAQGENPRIELLAGLGISKAQLEKAGALFGPNGELLSSAKTNLEAFERVVNEKYGNILDKMAGTTNAKLNTIQDRWQEAMIKIGNAIEKQILPALEKLASIIEMVGNSKTLEIWVTRATKLFEFLARHIGLVISGVGILIMGIGGAMAALGNVFAGLAAIVAGIALAIGGAKMQESINDMLDKIDKASKIAGNNTGKVPTDPNPNLGFGNIPSDPVKAAIERNTRLTAENTKPDLRKFALGGGPIGAMGVTPVELAGIRAFNRQIVVRVDAGVGRSMEQFMADIAQAAITSYVRQAGGLAGVR